MNHSITDAAAINQEFDAEARLEELQAAARQAQARGITCVYMTKPRYADSPGTIQAFDTNSPVDSDGRPNRKQRLVTLVVRTDLNGDHTLDKLGIDGLDRTAVATTDYARIHYFRVPDEAPSLPSRQLGPGVRMQAGGWQYLPPEMGLRWAEDAANYGLASAPEGLLTVDPIPRMKIRPAGAGSSGLMPSK